MTATTGLSGRKYELAATPFNSGGEGEIFDVQNYGGYIAKIYTGNITNELEQKIMFMNNKKPRMDILCQVAWPLDVLYDMNKHFCGFVMQRLNMTDNLQELYKYPAVQNISVSKKIAVARNICTVLSEIHKTGYTFGDFNPRNIGVNINTNKIYFLDIDSYHIVLDKKI
jgi:DNA-binding helix-hairpin-helix protein with protein kinase domain